MLLTKKFFSKLNPEKLVEIGDFILSLFLLMTFVAVFVPFSPGMPAAGLDSSWVFGMNQAVALGLSFGKDMIFTFGPYASIYTKAYHPSTDFMMISGSLYLALSYWACFVILMKDVQWRWVLAFCAVLSSLMYSRDALLFSLPLLVGLTTFKTLFSEEGKLLKSNFAPFYVALLFAPFGLLPLVKGSLLILCGAVATLSAAFFTANRHRLLAITCITTPIVSMFFFWVASGQSVTSLPNYVINMTPIASGYTEAMANDGNNIEIILYLVASVFLLLAISFQKKISNISKIFLYSIYIVFLFVSFKAGFVRHDGHALAAGISMLIAALLLPFIFNNRIIFPAIVFALISCLYIDSHYIKTSTESIANNFKSTYLSAWYGIKNRIEIDNWLKLQFDTTVSNLRDQASFPVSQGTTDIYSYNQSYLIASGNSWSPRPVLQSYSVYTPALAEINRKHLLGSQAPDNIIFKVEPIDGRFPSIEDGASWPLLMANYQPIQLINDFLFLRKKDDISKMAPPLKLVTEKHTFGESVNLPYSNQPIFAQILIRPTLLGRVANILYKPSQLTISLEMNNGIKKEYRIISGMAESGFLISPLISNTADFGLLYGENKFLEGKRVKSIEIASHGRNSIFWNEEYAITFSQIPIIAPIDLSKLYKFDEYSNDLSNYDVTKKGVCEGSIDVINDMSPLPAKLSISGLLEVSGWLATSFNQAALPEAVYVVLTDEQGNRKYLKTHNTPRPDVGAYFKKPQLNGSGYSTRVDISGLKAQYTLGLAYKQLNKINICSQFNIPVKISN